MSSRTETVNGDCSPVISTHSDSALISSSFFVGSPDALGTQYEGEPRTPRTMPTLGSTPRSRPAIERSLSYHYQRRTSSSATGQLSPHPGGLSIPTPSRPGIHHQQWSLFGQLMEHEGQLTSPVSYTPRRSRFSRQPSWSSSAFQSSIRARTSEPLVVDNASDIEPEDIDSPAIPTTQTNSPLPTLPVLWKNILKCSVAYFFASLFTLHPYLSNFFGDLTSYGSGYSGPSPTGHMIATM